MRLIQVHVVGAKAPQGAVDGLMDVFAGQAMVVLPGLPHREIDLGEDLQTFASLALQRLTKDGLGLGVGVGVRGVERSRARVPGVAQRGWRTATAADEQPDSRGIARSWSVMSLLIA